MIILWIVITAQVLIYLRFFEITSHVKFVVNKFSLIFNGK